MLQASGARLKGIVTQTSWERGLASVQVKHPETGEVVEGRIHRSNFRAHARLLLGQVLDLVHHVVRLVCSCSDMLCDLQIARGCKAKCVEEPNEVSEQNREI